MMSRAESIEYEILDCALNRATQREGYATTVNLFLTRLEQLFPNIEEPEFRQACKRLTRQKAIEVSFPSVGGYRNYTGDDDDVEYSNAKTVRLQPASLSHVYFRQLSALIETPPGFERHGLRRP
jgi:hypothetical protein